MQSIFLRQTLMGCFTCCILFSPYTFSQLAVTGAATTVFQNVGLLCFDKYKGYVDLSYLCYSASCVKIVEYDLGVRVNRETRALYIASKIVIENTAAATDLNSRKSTEHLRCETDCNGLNRRFSIDNLNLDKGKYTIFHGDNELGAIYVEDDKGTLSKYTCFGEDGIAKKSSN